MIVAFARTSAPYVIQTAMRNLLSHSRVPGLLSRIKLAALGPTLALGGAITAHITGSPDRWGRAVNLCLRAVNRPIGAGHHYPDRHRTHDMHLHLHALERSGCLHRSGRIYVYGLC